MYEEWGQGTREWLYYIENQRLRSQYNFKGYSSDSKAKTDEDKDNAEKPDELDKE